MCEISKEDFKRILSEGEGQNVDFKESFSGSMAKTIVAFANASGGMIILGVDDERNIKGIQDENRLRSQIVDIGNNCDPAIPVKLQPIQCDGKNVIVIHVKEGDDKPYKCCEGFFLRQGPNSQKMSSADIEELILDKHKLNKKYEIERRIKEVADKYCGFAESKERAGFDGLIHAGVAQLNSDEDVDKLFEIIYQYGEGQWISPIEKKLSGKDKAAFFKIIVKEHLDPGNPNDFAKAISLTRDKK